MPSSFKLPMVSLAVVIFLSACTSSFNSFKQFKAPSSPSQIFYKDGNVAYITSCKSGNDNWGECLKAAGSTCKEAGYTILEKSNSNYSYDDDRIGLVFACNAKPGGVEKK